MPSIPLRHGAFLPPFHPMNENPAACMERDLELMQWLDRLGFHEAWIGEHHSAGWELISSPELFIAVAAERTKWIKFGTGVISLPYHNPLMTANRIIQLDHHTRGRICCRIHIRIRKWRWSARSRHRAGGWRGSTTCR